MSETYKFLITGNVRNVPGIIKFLLNIMYGYDLFYVVHVYRKHKALLSIPVGSSTTASPSGRVDNPFEANVSDFVDDIFFPDSLSHDIHQLLHRDAYELKKKSILFLMQLKEEQQLTQTAVNVVVSGYKNMFEYTLRQLKAGVSRRSWDQF